MRISDWSSDVCSSDLPGRERGRKHAEGQYLARGEDAPCRVHAVDVLRAGLGADEDDRLAPSRRLFGAVGVEHDLARSGAGTGRKPLGQHIARRLGIERRVEELVRSEEHTSELQSRMRSSYAVFCLNNKKNTD